MSTLATAQAPALKLPELTERLRAAGKNAYYCDKYNLIICMDGDNMSAIDFDDKHNEITDIIYKDGIIKFGFGRSKTTAEVVFKASETVIKNYKGELCWVRFTFKNYIIIGYYEENDDNVTIHNFNGNDIVYDLKHGLRISSLTGSRVTFDNNFTIFNTSQRIEGPGFICKPNDTVYVEAYDITIIKMNKPLYVHGHFKVCDKHIFSKIARSDDSASFMIIEHAKLGYWVLVNEHEIIEIYILKPAAFIPKNLQIDKLDEFKEYEHRAGQQTIYSIEVQSGLIKDRTQYLSMGKDFIPWTMSAHSGPNLLTKPATRAVELLPE